MDKLGSRIATKDTYGQTLLRLGQENPRVVALEADLMKASGSTVFKNAFPERHFQVGIAEQNMVSIAAGMAAMGLIPFASTFACFLSQRACDQVINSVAYNKFNVKLCGSYAGLTSEKNGGTHISVEDLAIFRAMPNMVVLVPGDCVELSQAMEAAAAYDGPVYIRIARGNLTTIFSRDDAFTIGKARLLAEGSDVALVTTGITTWQGMKASQTLREKGIDVRHIHMPTIKPIDRDIIVRAADETGCIVTVENHSRIGGLGSAVAEVVCEECPVTVHRMGIDDMFGKTANLDYLMDFFGISAPHIVERVEQSLVRKDAVRICGNHSGRSGADIA